jgi:murein DD-endopeptidase MepM/ murein hydrolase activator NlpD
VAAPRGRWRWPLVPRPAVARPFVPPRSTWGAGHRGADLAAVVGQPVRAVADGTVTHVGVVAGRPTLTVTHPDGLRSTYEPVHASVHRGDEVRAGQVLGVVVGAGSHCTPAACLHLGALRGTAYLDPLSLLGPVRVRLLPLWGPGSGGRSQAPVG